MKSTPAREFSPATNAALALHDAGLVVTFIPRGEKGPRAREWQSRRPTRADIIKRYEANPDDSLGVLLGPAGGIIDIEGDGPDAPARIRELFNGEPIATFSVAARRGTHRFYRWDDRFANLPAKFNVGSLEFRIGTSALQSLVWGETDDPDREREHVRRFDPSDVSNIAALPDEVIDRIVGLAPATASKTESSSDDFLSDLNAKILAPRVLSALGALHPSRADNRDDWLKVACALKSLGESYFGVFDAWSLQSPKYGDTRRVWDSLSPDGGISVGTLFHLAEHDGWTPPTAKPPQPQSNLLPSVTLRELLNEADEPIVPVVDGLIAAGDVTSFVAPPKRGKTWLMLQLAGSIATGSPFLGMEVTRGNVLMYDNELRLRDMRRRFRVSAKAVGLTELDKVTLVSLKGQHVTLDMIRDDILARIERGDTFHLITIDALYKTFAPGTDENATGDMTRAYAVLEEIANKTDSAVVIVHHTTKGNQRGKSVTDIGSGSGVQSRSVDNHASITAVEKQDDVFVLAASVRNFQAFPPRCIRFQFPLWVLAPEFDLDGRTDPTLEDFLATIPIEPAEKTETIKASRQQLGCTVAQIKTLLSWAVDDELVATPDRKKQTDKQMIHLTKLGATRIARRAA